MRKRVMPYVGQPVAIVYLGVIVEGAVERLEDGGRRLAVLSEEGEQLIFLLDQATGGFTLAGGQTAAQLRFRAE
jgi:hypothetical protein